MERGRLVRIGRVRVQSSPEGQVRIVVWNILTLYAASIKDVLIITPHSSLLPPPPLSSLLPSASIFFRLFIYSFYFCRSHPFFLSLLPLLLSLLSSPLPNVFLSGLRWNRKCWFNNSWSEFWAVCWFSQFQVQHRRCSSLPSSSCNAEWNHTALCDALMHFNDSPLVMYNSMRGGMCLWYGHRWK